MANKKRNSAQRNKPPQKKRRTSVDIDHGIQPNQTPTQDRASPHQRRSARPPKPASRSSRRRLSSGDAANVTKRQVAARSSSLNGGTDNDITAYDEPARRESEECPVGDAVGSSDRNGREEPPRTVRSPRTSPLSKQKTGTAQMMPRRVGIQRQKRKIPAASDQLRPRTIEPQPSQLLENENVPKEDTSGDEITPVYDSVRIPETPAARAIAEEIREVQDEVVEKEGDPVNGDVLSSRISEGVVEELNFLKQKVQKLEEELMVRGILVKVAQEQSTALKQQLREKELVIDGLRGALKQEFRKSSRASEPGQTGRKKHRIAVSDAFRGVARGVYQNMLTWARRETSELCFEGEKPSRNWTNRAEKLDGATENGEGILGNEEGVVAMVPKNPVELLASFGMFTPSVEGGADALLRTMVQSELKEVSWEGIRNASLTERCTLEVCADMCLRQRMKQTMSDVVGVRKKNTRDKLFLLLGYDLIWRRTKVVEENADEVEQQLREAQENILRIDANGTPTTSWWRKAPLDRLKYSKAENDGQEMDTNEQDLFFRNKVGVEVLKEFIGYDVEDKKEGTLVDGTILTLARLDAWILTVVTLLTAQSPRGGQRQKQFTKTFAELLPLCLKDLLVDVRQYVQRGHSNEFNHYGSAEHEWTGVLGNDMREATIAFRMPSSGKLYLTLRERFFVENVSKRLGSVTDCFIGECEETDMEFMEMDMRGFRSSTQIGGGSQRGDNGQEE